ncbi:unnamed protein product [Cylindrotheca closterium]|uniref:F-box domain-containing protein n=1 Tax=Cylindrotheca closterium TaxID=2856 RepID=A0AAD2FBZ1_9STRA|nr:unnamed protein product [Cylindrotheca closterium]
MLLDLPEDALRSVALHLEAPDVLSLLSTHKDFQEPIGRSATFWGQLLARDFDLAAGSIAENTSPRQEYLTKAYVDHLPAARWYPIRRRPVSVSAREGHLACVLPGPDNEQRVVITGGYSDDDEVYMMRVPSKSKTNNTVQTWSWESLMPGNSRPSFTYGASLNALDATTMKDGCHVARAIRFGGFQAGGYSNEVNQVWLMTARSEKVDDKNSPNPLPRSTSVSWDLIQTTNPQCGAPRAYHTATLIAGRYLVILGGMMWRESILSEAILDTQTWTWITDPITSFGNDKPSGRHGHSVILDSRRNRLLLFGGGSGTDLLRSGKDNSEVWELKMNDDWETNLKLPWTWSKIHNDTCTQSEIDEDENENGEEADGNSDTTMQTTRSSPPLPPAEALCIGRCHHGIKVTPNTAVFLFGSGRPSTNGVIGYDLRNDCFLRPRISGPLPVPRFSGVAVYLESEGYLMTHGGYSSQQSDCIDDLSILDLAPFVKRDFTVLPVDTGRRPHREITNDDAQNGRINRGYGGNMFEQHQFLTQIVSLTRGGLVTPAELEELLASRGIVSNNGVVVLGEGGDYDNDDDDDDDEYYVEE